MAAGVQHEASPPPFPDSPVRLVPYSRSWHIAKVALRSISAIICIVVFGLCGYQGTQAYTPADTAAALPPAVLAFFWNIAEFITLFVRRQKQRGIHPGIVVAAELILSGGMLASMSLLAWNISYEGWWNSDDETNHHYVEAALLTMIILLLGIHFTLFVRACKETDERNKSREKSFMVYVPGGGSPFCVEDTPYGLANQQQQAASTAYRAHIIDDNNVEEAIAHEPVIQKEIMPTNTRYVK